RPYPGPKPGNWLQAHELQDDVCPAERVVEEHLEHDADDHTRRDVGQEVNGPVDTARAKRAVVQQDREDESKEEPGRHQHGREDERIDEREAHDLIINDSNIVVYPDPYGIAKAMPALKAQQKRPDKWVAKECQEYQVVGRDEE